MMELQLFDGGIGGGVADARRSWRPFSVGEGVGGGVRLFEMVQDKFLDQLELDWNHLGAFSKAEKAEKWGEGGERVAERRKKELTLNWLTPCTPGAIRTRGTRIRKSKNVNFNPLILCLISRNY